MPLPTPAERMDRLERDLVQMRIHWERFFNGAPGVEFPDVERERTRIGHELRKLRNAKLAGVEENFRLASLEARYASYSELFGRRVRQLEEGAAPATARETESGPDPREGVVVADRVEDRTVEVLYRGLHLEAGAQPRFDLASFRTYLERQLTTIRSKTGCDRVVFRIAEEDGKMKLKARPVRPEAPPA